MVDDTRGAELADSDERLVELIANKISAVLLKRLPTLESLEQLERRVTRVRIAENAIYFDASQLVSAEEMERAYFTHVLETVSGNRSRAAELLEIDVSTLYRKLRRWELE